MKTVLITGSKGFVGRHFMDFFRKKNYHVVGTGSSLEIDLCNLSEVLELPATDVIIHLAAKSFVPDSFKNPFDFYKNNFQSTLNILELAKRNNSKIIFFSTYVYGIPGYLPIDEEHPVTALNPYTQSKLLGEELCKAYSRDFGLPIVIFRPFNLFGPWQQQSFLIPKIIDQIKNGMIKLADPTPRRDFIFIDDVSEAVDRSIITSTKEYQVFNLGSGDSVSVDDLVQLMIKLTGSKSKVIYSNSRRQGEIQNTIADISKIQKHLDWFPKTSLIDGLLKTMEIL